MEISGVRWVPYISFVSEGGSAASRPRFGPRSTPKEREFIAIAQHPAGKSTPQPPHTFWYPIDKFPQ